MANAISQARSHLLMAHMLVLIASSAPLGRRPSMKDMIHRGSSVTADEMRARFRGAGIYRTIAVVGSSGNLLFQRHGADIDSHGLVLRFNKAITMGYEADVGRDVDSGRSTGVIRMNHIMGYREGRDSHLLADDELIIETLQDSGDKGYDTGGRPNLQVSTGWIQSVHRDLLNGDGTRPSTGFVGLAIAVAVAVSEEQDSNPYHIPTGLTVATPHQCLLV